MTDPDPIADARRLLAEYDGMPWMVWTGMSARTVVGIPKLLAALCDRLEAAEREFRQTHEDNCTPDYTERGLHSSWCRLYMVGPE